MQRQPQQAQLPDPNEVEKSILEQYTKAKANLSSALSVAKNILKTGDYGTYNASATVELGVILFQLLMSKEQGLMKVKQLRKMKEQKKQ